MITDINLRLTLIEKELARQNTSYNRMIDMVYKIMSGLALAILVYKLHLA